MYTFCEYVPINASTCKLTKREKNKKKAKEKVITTIVHANSIKNKNFTHC